VHGTDRVIKMVVRPILTDSVEQDFSGHERRNGIGHKSPCGIDYPSSIYGSRGHEDGCLLPGANILHKRHNHGSKGIIPRYRIVKEHFIYILMGKTAMLTAILQVLRFYTIFVECSEYLAL